MAPGGGAKPRWVICQDLFGKDIDMKDLDEEDEMELEQAERAGYRWHNSHRTLSVHSTSCAGTVKVSESEDANARLPCAPCKELLIVKAFQTALSHPTPDPKNLKFTPNAARIPAITALVKQQLGVDALISSVCF